MRLLVSVRSEQEVAAALAGGADIIDAKEPRHGALGRVSRDVLARIIDCVPTDYPLSIALGDAADPRQLETLISSLELPVRDAPAYLKVGFAGVPSSQAILGLLNAGVAAARRHRSTPRIIAVSYADYSRAKTAAPESIMEAAVHAGCDGVLLDTFGKSSGSLLSCLTIDTLEAWIFQGRMRGILVAIAGGLDVGELPVISALSPDVLGVRGAACDGGRNGQVNSARVARLLQLIGSSSEFLQPFEMPIRQIGSRKA